MGIYLTLKIPQVGEIPLRKYETPSQSGTCLKMRRINSGILNLGLDISIWEFSIYNLPLTSPDRVVYLGHDRLSRIGSNSFIRRFTYMLVRSYHFENM